MSVREVFDRSARDYDRTRRILVTGFDDFYGAALASLPFPPEQPIAVLDLGAGTGLLSLFVAERYPGARLRLVDVASEMLSVARERFASEAHRFEFVVADYADGLGGGRYDVVASALSIHHLDADAKRRLFGEAHDALRPGGVFVNADQVAGQTPEEDAHHLDQWLGETRARGATEEDLRVARERMREDRPSTVADQLGWMREAGLSDVACPFRHGMFAVFRGSRAPA